MAAMCYLQRLVKDARRSEHAKALLIISCPAIVASRVAVPVQCCHALKLSSVQPAVGVLVWWQVQYLAQSLSQWVMWPLIVIGHS